MGIEADHANIPLSPFGDGFGDGVGSARGILADDDGHGADIQGVINLHLHCPLSFGD